MLFWHKVDQEREQHRQQKFERGQKAMLSAAASTTNTAYSIAEQLRREPSLHRESALLLCDRDGVVSGSNETAKRLFECEVKARKLDELLHSEKATIGDLLHSAANHEHPSIPIPMTVLTAEHSGLPVEVSITGLSHEAPDSEIMVSVKTLDLNAERRELFKVVTSTVQDAFEHLKQRVG